MPADFDAWEREIADHWKREVADRYRERTSTRLDRADRVVTWLYGLIALSFFVSLVIRVVQLVMKELGT